MKVRLAAHVRALAAVAMAALLAAAGVMTAQQALAATVASPTDVAVAFSSWSAGLAQVSVTWTPQPDADGYVINYAAGTTPPASTGAGMDVPESATDSATVEINSTARPISFSVWAYTGTSAHDVTALSTPTSTTYSLPGPPEVTSVPVSGAEGKAVASWGAPTFPGDTLVVRVGAGAGNGPTGGSPAPVAAGQRSATISGLPNYSPSNPGYLVAVYELTGGDPDKWSPASFTLAYAAPGPQTQMVSPNLTSDATRLTVSWGPPSCTVVVPNQYCNYAVLIENPGSKIATSPSDGKLETSATGLPNGTAARISDVVPGQTYTFTVFNVATINGIQYWSAGTSQTIRIMALPKVSLTSSTGSTASAAESVTLTTKLSTIGTNPTGTVTFRNAETVFCKAVPVVARAAQCKTRAALIGTPAPEHPSDGVVVSAVYSGDAMDYESGADLRMVIQPVTPTMAVKIAGQRSPKATVTTMVRGSAGTATGRIDMVSAGRSLCYRSLHNGSAACSLTSKAWGRGKHSVSIRYGGSGAYRAHTTKVTVKLSR